MRICHGSRSRARTQRTVNIAETRKAGSERRHLCLVHLHFAAVSALDLALLSRVEAQVLKQNDLAFSGRLALVFHLLAHAIVQERHIATQLALRIGAARVPALLVRSRTARSPIK